MQTKFTTVFANEGFKIASKTAENSAFCILRTFPFLLRPLQAIHKRKKIFWDVMALHEHDSPTPNSSDQFGLYAVQNYNFVCNFV
jgi:hypothetical protein